MILLSASAVQAQEQERKLMDRLLEPNMKLQNDAQGKKFDAGGNDFSKQAPTKTFFIKERPAERGFWNRRKFSTKDFATDSSPAAKMKATLTARNDASRWNSAYATGGYRDVRESTDARKKVGVSQFVSGRREWVPDGKTQKALDSHKTPMTLEQVRELLNKNK